MSLFRKCMFSNVEGIVTYEGKPMAGVGVGRFYNWVNKDEEFLEESFTDENGYFSFPAAYNNSVFTTFLPHEPVIFQFIVFDCADQQYTGWRYVKHSYDIGGELKAGHTGGPLKLKCELTSEKDKHDTHWGICELVA